MDNMKLMAVTGGILALVVLAQVAPAGEAVPEAVLLDTLPGINQPFDDFNPVAWGREVVGHRIPNWDFKEVPEGSGNFRAVTDPPPDPDPFVSTQRLFYVTTLKGDPQGNEPGADTPMPTDTGFVFGLTVNYSDSLHTVVSLEGEGSGRPEVRIFGPNQTEQDEMFVVNLRNFTGGPFPKGNLSAPFLVPKNTDARFTIHYKGTEGDERLDVWVNEEKVVDDFQLPQDIFRWIFGPWELNVVQLGGGNNDFGGAFQFDQFVVGHLSRLLFGDVNNDALVNNLDITPFIAALAAEDEAAFLIAFPNGNYDAADIDMSGSPNNLDITPFIGLLTAASATAVPEPGSLACIALALMMGRRRRPT